MKTVATPGRLSSTLPIIDTAWAIEPVVGRRVRRFLELDILSSGIWDEDEEEQAFRPYPVENGIAILSLSGLMTKRLTWLSYYFGGISTVQMRRRLSQAVSDPDVKGLLLVVDSPGGQVSGTADLAQDVADAGAQKPVMAYIEDMGCSAAYWVASQASHGLYCNRTATVGSIGTLMVIEDRSKQAEEAGVRVRVIASGEDKGRGAEGAPLTDADLAYFRDYVDSLNTSFLAAVQSARSLSETQMQDVRTAGLYVAEAARRAGLVDGIASLDAVKQKLRWESERRLPQGPALCALRIHPPRGELSTTPAEAGREGRKMRDTLVRILTLLGLRKMAEAVVGAKEDSPEALAQAMSEQVTAEVDEKVRAHPLLIACETAGIGDASQLQRVLEMKNLGEAHLRQLRSEATSQAVRAYGPETGPRIAAVVDSLPAQEVKTLRDGWQAEADSRFGIGKDGEAAQRVSAPRAIPSAVAADDPPAPLSSWEQLTHEQRQTALQMGMTTLEKQEKFASDYLAGIGGKR
jgi:signal peptide peptidase SppA